MLHAFLLFSIALYSVDSITAGKGQKLPNIFIVDGENGKDTNDGLSTEQPLKTITECVSRLAKAGDECQIREGRYHEVVTIENIKGKIGQPIKISGYGDERPIWDGSELIQPEEWSYDEKTKICTATIEKDITSLFYKNDLLTLARWPNSLWADKTIFLKENWRPCEDSIRGTIVDNELASAGIDFKGAMAILNIGSFKTFVREVLDFKLGSSNFTYNDDFGEIKFQSKQYYLESKLSLLDSAGEWYYDKGTKQLHVILPPDNNELGPCPQSKPFGNNLRGRTMDYGLKITNSRFISIANISFFAANVIAQDRVSSISLDSIDFMFPASSHRALQEDTLSLHTVVEGADSSVVNCTFHGSDGNGLEVSGDNFTVKNNYFSYNDWVGQGSSTILAKTFGGEISHNSLWYNGISPGIRYQGRQTLFSFNHIEGQCWGLIRSDGASFQISPSAANGVTVLKNWVHDSPKKGIRFDGAIGGINGTVSHNVVWNIWNSQQEIYPKGDNHTVINNVAYSDDDKCTVCVNSEHWGHPNHNSSIVLNNAATTMGNGGLVVENNFESKNLEQEMVDTFVHDFRPVPGGNLTKGRETIGAYEVNITKYWIPGRQLYKTSYPIPPDASSVEPRQDLICQVGYQADQHHFYLGASQKKVAHAESDADEYQYTLLDGDNIFPLPKLMIGKTYYWRVDAQRGGNVYRGDVWSFAFH